MAKKKVDITKTLSSKKDKNTHSKEERKPNDDPKPLAFYQLRGLLLQTQTVDMRKYKFATPCDLFLIFIGVLASIGTGVLQPINTYIFGILTGNIIKYATISMDPSILPEVLDEAKTEFMKNITDFTIQNCGIGFGMLVLSYISTEVFNYTSLKQIFKIRSLYLQKVLDKDIGWYDVNQTGDFASRMSDDLTKLEDGIGEKVPTFINFQSVFVSALLLAFIKGWELALVCLTSLPLSMLAIGIIAFLTSKFAKNELQAYGAAGAIAEEVLSTIRTVVAFGGQDKEIERYDKHLVNAKQNNIKRAMMTGLGFGLLWFFIYGSYALAFWYGVRLVIDNRNGENSVYDPATMITVFFGVMTGSMNFGISSPFIEAFGKAKAAGAKIFKIIEEEPIINKSKDAGTQIPNLKGNITFRNVKFHYPSRIDVPILQGLDLDIKAGETVALVGSSGCGKSTCVQLIQRYYDPLTGEVLLDGVNIKDLDLTWMRNNIGVVGQEPILFGTTIKENIRYGKLDASDEDIQNAAIKANAHDFIRRLPNGYETLVGERGAQLSGGQKQRIAIARALVRNPIILLLDEATSALDNESEAKVQKAIDSASKERTTIIVAHRLTTIRGANKIVVISKGKVVEQGTDDDLMKLKGEYYNLVAAQDKSAISDTIINKNDEEDSFEHEEKRISIENKESIEVDDDAELIKNASLLSLLKMNTPEWFNLLLGSIGGILMGCSMPVFAILLGDILGVLSANSEDYVRKKANTYCLYFLIAGVVAGISTFTQIYMFSIAGEKLTMRIRSMMFKSMLRQEMGFYDRKENGVGALCSRLSTEAAQVQGATGQKVGTILQSIATLGLSIGLSMYYEWRIGLVALCFTPFILVVTYLQRKQSQGQNEHEHDSLQKSTKVAIEAVSNIRTVASLCCERTFHGVYIDELRPFLKETLKNSHGRAIVLGLARSLMYFAYSACIYYGGYLIKSENLPYENMFKVSQALIMGTVSIANALAFTPNMQKGILAAQKVRKLLNRVPKVNDEDNAKHIEWESGNINYSQIYFSYPTRPNVTVLKDLQLDVLKGKTIALVGSSGCGKSTIIQLLERFYDPDSGKVSVDGENLKTMALSSLRSNLGIVSQEPNLFNRSIQDNIAYGDNSRVVSMAEIMEAARNANIHDFISKLPLGYETLLGEKGTQLSGGQKQRIAIARALVRNPKVLLLDEATSALDTESEAIVQEALDKARDGRTCITIAHRLTTIQNADVICVIDQGKVAEMGNHEELIKQGGLYYKLDQLQRKNK